MMNGKGVFIWPDGSKYEGDFAYDLKDGNGVFTWPDGKQYTGSWKNGK